MIKAVHRTLSFHSHHTCSIGRFAPFPTFAAAIVMNETYSQEIISLERMLQHIDFDGYNWAPENVVITTLKYGRESNSPP